MVRLLLCVHVFAANGNGDFQRVEVDSRQNQSDLDDGEHGRLDGWSSSDAFFLKHLHIAIKL